MGKGDKRTRRGKIFKGTFGTSRLRKKNTKPAVATAVVEEPKATTKKKTTKKATEKKATTATKKKTTAKKKTEKKADTTKETKSEDK